jgi:hypothetical protein
MNIELFLTTYTPTMMQLIERLSEKLKLEIKEDLECENYHVIIKAKDKICQLAECKMLLSIYEGCLPTKNQDNENTTKNSH